VLLWLGERNTDLRLPGTLALHDAATLLLCVLVAGHISKALSTPGALEGIRRGTVSARYAAEHHEKWRPSTTAPDGVHTADETEGIALSQHPGRRGGGPDGA